MTESVAVHNLILRAQTAGEIMTPNPFSIYEETPVQQAAAFLEEKAFSAAPVVDEHCRVVGVISRTDIARECGARAMPDFHHTIRTRTESGDVLGTVFHNEHPDDKAVGEIMRAMVIAVPPEAPVSRVIALMLAENIHRVFVTDNDGKLIGVVSGVDILSRLTE